MENQNNRNFTRENEDRFLFKTPAVPLFPAAASTATGPAVNSSAGKSNQMKQENMRPGQPFWKMMTQSDSSPLQSVNQSEGRPFHGIGNNQNRGSGNDSGGPFRRNFRGAGEIPLFNQSRDDAAINPFLRGLPHGQPSIEGTNINLPIPPIPPIPQTFDYNHGVPGPGGPIGQQGPNMGPPNRPERPQGPRPLMEVTIPNPAALFQKLHAALDKKDDPSSSRDPRKEGYAWGSPRQKNDSQKRQAGPRPGDQGKQKGSPGKGRKTQNEAWNRGLKRMTELQNQLVQCEQAAKKRKTETNSNKKGQASKLKTPPVLEYDAESLKLTDAIAQGSQTHQLQLVKAAGIKENFTGRVFTPWKCYICDTETWTWQAYIIHCKTKEHKSQAIGLGTTFMKDEKIKLVNVLRKLPFARVSFSIGGTNSEDGSKTYVTPSSSSTSSTPESTEAMSNKKGMSECKPCGRFFLQRERLLSHMKSESHLKRESFLKQRYGNSWLDYHWYNQSQKTDRRDGEPQGVAFVLPVSGYFCKLCSRFYNSEITAKDVHCRQIGHIDKVKEWDRQQLTKKEAIKLKLNPTEIETAVKKKEELASRISRWSRPKLTTINPAEVVVIDSDGEDENDKKKKTEATVRGQRVENSNARKEVSKIKNEDLEEGELSEAEVLRMEKQQQEDKIKEEWMKREAKKREKEQKERELREKERKDKEAKERKEREAREEMERQRIMKEREKSKRAKEEKEKRERERLERDKMMRKLQEEKRQLELKKKEFQEQVEREKKEKEEKERWEREEKEKLEKARKLQEEQEKKLREKRLREMLELETRIRQQEKRERGLLEERVRLGQMLALSAGTRDRTFIERDMRDKEIRGRVVREQLDKDIKQLEELKRLQLEQVAPDTRARQEEDTRAKLEAEMKKAEETRLREERLKEVEKREKELQEIEKREQERQRIEEKERELLEIEMRDKARREQELQERREQEMLAIRELERKARLEEEMQARREQEMEARHEQEMKARQEQEMKARQEQEMQARREQEMQARQEQGMQARQEQEMQAMQEQEMQARREQEMLARKEQEIQARQEQEMNSTQEQEMQTMREQEMRAMQEQEMLRIREQEILVRREQDIQAWQMREAQMVAEGVSEMDILQQRQVFQQQLEEKYKREEPLTVKDIGVTGEARNLEMEREMFINELRQKARGELMMKGMQLQREGLTDAQIQEVMAREEEIMKQRIFEEMERRGFTDVGVLPGHSGAREINPVGEQGMGFGENARDQEEREWDLIEQEIIERERSSREREMRSPARDYDERDNVRYIEEADGRPIEGVRDENVRYDRDYPPSPENYNEDDDYNSDDGSHEEDGFGDDYDNVQGNDGDERFAGSNRDGTRYVAPRRDSAPRQSRPPQQRPVDRRRKRKRGGRGRGPRRNRQGRGGAARRGR